MEKRYQIFVSSTFADLKEERSRVIQTLMEMDCIPAGMELFPAADEEQWEFIKKVINDCDYYLLIIGGRYGTTTNEGISYTEKEYEYACEIGLKIVALIHENPDLLPESKSEQEEDLKLRLQRFRERVSTGRLVKMWNKPEDLPGNVALSLNKTIKMYPALGWSRGTNEANEKLLTELNELRKENEQLKYKIKKYENDLRPKIELASLDKVININGEYYKTTNQRRFLNKWETSTTWKNIFSLISPFILNMPNEDMIKIIIDRELSKLAGVSGNITNQMFQTIKIQFISLGLIESTYEKTVAGGMAWFWTLTNAGKKLMLELRTIKE
ncbi:DUF4062 domain-containing protein [Leptospira idonii]|uniref:DUF4062 domain-containing protein n=1 Tax=Leptospira idonii TaxID=1193500 RepID=A0A4R9M1K0_9LEPT|nr:DUF4062 domain-containing protein [Leptospira idonii]TGN20644.1 DUF4062 domain-containing protein [Leptospira idonii]